MAELSTLARPYAKAAFQVAYGSQALEQWSAMLATLTAVADDSKVKALLSSPSATAEQKAAQVIDLCGDALDGAGSNFVKTLAANQRLPLLPFIREQFETLKAALEKTVDVELTTAMALDDAQVDQLVAALKQRSQCDVSISSSVDASLLGGAVIRIGDTVIDGSLRGRLTELSHALNS